MGEFLSPREARRDVYDRLRRRLEQYRHHHSSNLGRFDNLTNGLSEHQRQETLLLQQRWTDSKTKKAAKSSKGHSTNRQQQQQQQQQQQHQQTTTSATGEPNNTNTTTTTTTTATSTPQQQQTTTDVRNQQTSKLKRKLDSQPPPAPSGECNTTTTTVDQIYNFDDTESPSSSSSAAKQKSSGVGLQAADSNGHNLHSQVSVNIVQQINAPSDRPSQTSQIKLTVSSTVHAGAKASGGSAATSTSIQTNTICKQEPQEVVDSSTSSSAAAAKCAEPSDSSHASSFQDAIVKDFMYEVDDDLKALLDDIPADVFKDLIENNDDVHNFETNVTVSGNNNNKFDSLGGDSVDKKDSVSPGMFADPLYDTGSPGGQNFGAGMGGGIPMSGYPRQPPGGAGNAGGAAPPPPLLGDTGPAAEVLKQMAAQHQNHENTGGSMHSGMSPDAFMDTAGYGRRGSTPSTPFSPYPGQAYTMGAAQGGNMYGYGPHSGAHVANMGRSDGPMPQMQGQGAAVTTVMSKTDSSMSYGSTKPLTHFSDQSSSSKSTPSSLQQLQNQVQTQFSQSSGQGQSYPSTGPHMQLKQSQHMQMSQGIHLSQTQQLQIHSGGNGADNRMGPAASAGPGQHISLAQQQSFNMTAGPGSRAAMRQGAVAPQYMSDADMKMQMYQQQQQQQQQAAAKASVPPSNMDPHTMQAYMNQQQQQQPGAGSAAPPAPAAAPAPPEYGKGAPSARPGAHMPPQAGAENMRPDNNPLQTMQNMVNQTSQNLHSNATPGAMYGAMKTEMTHAGSGQAGVAAGGGAMAQTMAAAAGQQMPPGASRESPHSGASVSMSSGFIGPSPQLQAQHQQQHPHHPHHPHPPPHPRAHSHPEQQQPHPQHMAEGYPLANGGAGAPSAGSGANSRSSKASTPMYTSAIMRGQRPPNVNVGPEGLNISQQRSAVEWQQRAPMMGPVPHGMHSGGGGGGGGGGGMPPHGHHPMVMGMHPSQQQQQQQQQAMGGRPFMPPGAVSMGMMQYGGYPGTLPPGQPGAMGPGPGGGGGVSMGPRMHMAQHQSMHAHVPHINSGGGGGAMPVAPHMAGMNPGVTNTSIRMAQHQHMNMHHHPANGQSMTMAQSSAMAVNVSQGAPLHPQQQGYPGPPPPPHQQQPQPQPPPTSQAPAAERNNGPEFSLDFLDGAQSGGPSADFFDSVVQNTNPPDFNFIDDILGGK